MAVLSPDRDAAEVDKIFHDTDSVRRLIKRLGVIPVEVVDSRSPHLIV